MKTHFVDTKYHHIDNLINLIKRVSYIDGVYELMHDSQTEAVKYLRHIGYDNASNGDISNALNDKRKSNFAYDRTWQLI
jgi:hypothetical protein